jgi:hypothetical protein
MPNKKKEMTGLLVADRQRYAKGDDVVGEYEEYLKSDKGKIHKANQDAHNKAVTAVYGRFPGAMGPPKWAVSLLAKVLGVNLNNPPREEPAADVKDPPPKLVSGHRPGIYREAPRDPKLDSDRERYQIGGIASKIAKALTRGGKKKRSISKAEEDEIGLRQAEEDAASGTNIGGLTSRELSLVEAEISDLPAEEIQGWELFRGHSSSDHLSDDELKNILIKKELDLIVLRNEPASAHLSETQLRQLNDFGSIRRRDYPDEEDLSSLPFEEVNDDLPFAKGGLLSSDRQQYAMGDEVVAADIPMPEEDIAMPMPQEEMAMAPDDEMEDNYLDFVVSESLNPDEQNYLMEALTADENLSVIFDKLMNTATEFAGSGPVEGPGSAVSDSIPARLSDGEFVLTSKATDEIGPDNIQAMMKDAEARSDQRQMAQEGGVIREDLENLEDTDAIKQGMLSVNPRMRTG